MNGNFAEIPLRADTTRPKLTQQNVTDVIAYMNRGGSVLIMENVMSTLTEESASDFVRLLDAAGLSMALNSSVVKSDPQGYPNVVRQRRGRPSGSMSVTLLSKVSSLTPSMKQQEKSSGSIKRIISLMINLNQKSAAGLKKLRGLR